MQNKHVYRIKKLNLKGEDIIYYLLHQYISQDHPYNDNHLYTLITKNIKFIPEKDRLSPRDVWRTEANDRGLESRLVNGVYTPTRPWLSGSEVKRGAEYYRSELCQESLYCNPFKITKNHIKFCIRAKTIVNKNKDYYIESRLNNEDLEERIKGERELIAVFGG